MATSLFIFGTLLDDQVLELISKHPVDQLERQSASLIGFEPRYVIDQFFPVLVLAPSSITYGDVIVVDNDLLHQLNIYEQDHFELCEICVKLEDGSDCHCLYYANVDFETISDRRWSLEEFQRLHKDSYVRELAGLPPLH